MLVAMRIYILFIVILTMTVFRQPALAESTSNTIHNVTAIETKRNISTDQMINFMTLFLGIPFVIFLLRKQKTH